MAKKITPLTFRDIVLGAEAEVIRQALEARAQIDELIIERQAAYERIAALENQVEDVLGEAGTFPFPAPPLPVAGFDPKSATVTRSAAAVKKVAAALDPEPAAEEEPSDEAEDETEVEASEDDTEEKDA